MPYTGRLDQVSSISIQPDGGIAVCDEWTIGNAAHDDIVDLLRGYDPARIPEMAGIREGGVAALAAEKRVIARGIKSSGSRKGAQLYSFLRQGKAL